MVSRITWCVLVAAMALAAIVPLAAQTPESPAIAQTDTLGNAPEIRHRVAVPADSTAKIDAVTEVEIQRRINDLRSEVEIRQGAGESSLDADIADAYSLEEAGNIEAAIEKWRSIANDAKETDSELAASAWISVGYLLREKDKNDTE